MKFTCLQEPLAAALSLINRAVTAKGSLAILTNILISAEQGRVKLSATDLQIGLSTWIGAKVEEVGLITVPGRIITSFLAALPPQKLNLESKKQLLRIQTQQGWAQVNGMDASDFPELPERAGDPLFVISGELLADALEKVIFSAAQDEGRPILTGLLFELKPGGLSLVGVDGFRLSEKTVALDEKTEKDFRLVIPAKALAELARLASKNEAVKMWLLKEKNQVIFEVGEVILTSRLLEGEFPNYKQIIPSSFKTRADIPLEEFKKAVQISSIFAEGSANVLKLKLSPAKGQVTVSANTQDVGDNVTYVPANVEGDEGEIAFNTRYLSDILGCLTSEEIYLELSDSLSPGVIKSVGDATFLHIIMPVRVQGE